MLAIDSITRPTNVYILDGSDDIQSFPDYVGNPFSLGREDHRTYMVRDDDDSMTWTSDIKYQPHFLVQ